MTHIVDRARSLDLAQSIRSLGEKIDIAKTYKLCRGPSCVNDSSQEHEAN